MKETELAEKVVDWLQEQNWDVYQEVQPNTSDRTADIVAVNGPLLWIIECKTSLSLALLEQAYRWNGYANLVSIAIPQPRRETRGAQAAEMFLRDKGIGKIQVGDRCERITQGLRPKLRRKRLDAIGKCLREEHKTFVKAGSASGEKWTPFRATRTELYRIVHKNPGIIFSDAMKELKHHYSTDSTARNCISRYLRNRVINEVVCEKDGRYLRLYPAEK